MQHMVTHLVFLMLVVNIGLYIKLPKATQKKCEMDQRLRDVEREWLLLETHHPKLQMQPHALKNIRTELKALSKRSERTTIG